uniref:G_PROTEIN_RECEP_F1_2 domain-containing protein n=1 Tax=Strongyloides venezuelensis TaxID=75913 RepID=A0A0K0F3B1_STRVS
MNNSNPELLINKIGRYLPFMYPTYDVYQISIILIFAILSYILHGVIAVTIIRSWKTSDYFNSSYFKVVVFESINDVIHNIIFLLFIFTTELGIVAEYLKENVGLPLLSKSYCSLPYDYNYEKEMYFRAGKRGEFNCRYPFGYTRKEYHFMYIALVNSLTIISIILTIIITCKIKKISKTTSEFSVIAIKKRNKEKRMTRYVIIIGIMQLICLIQDQLYYIKIKINGYDESIRYIISGLRPFVGVSWMFINALSIIFISKTLRDSVFKNLKLDIIYRKLFKDNLVVPSSHSPNIKQNMNRGIKNRTVI